MMRFKVTISKQWLGWFFLLLWYFDLPYFSTISWLGDVFNLGKVVSFFVVIYMYLKEKVVQFSKFAVWIIVYEILLMLVTMGYGGSVNSQVIMAATYIGLIITLEYMLSKDSLKALSVMMFIFEVIIYANYISVLIFPRGLYKVKEDANRFYWLTGHQNSTILYVLCGIVIAVLYSQYVKNRGKLIVRSQILIVVSCIMMIDIWSATAIAGLIIVAIVLFLNKIKFKLSAKMAILLSLVAFFAFVFFRLQDYFSVIIVNLLQRDLTFTGRTRIWERAIYFIEQRPILGYGVEQNQVARLRFGFSTCHNKYLYSLYQGGIVLFGIFLIILLQVARELDKYAREYEITIVVACFWALLIQMQFESYAAVLFYLPLVLGANIDKIVCKGSMTSSN